MKKLSKVRIKKALNGLLDTMLFVVPILELSEIVTIIPPEYLPYYMLATVLLRRGVRLLEAYLDRKAA